MSAGLSVPASAAARGDLQQTLVTLVRREFWEHRTLWLAPLATAALLVVGTLFARHMQFQVDDVSHAEFSARQALAVSTIAQAVVFMTLNLVAALFVSFYLVDCLYAERRDRSISFWKSMPVSDGLTVASKLLVAMVAVPLGVWALAAATHVVISVVFAVHAALGHVPANAVAWHTLTWLRVELLLLIGSALGVAWNAPIAGYFLLVSVLARRNAVMWAMGIPLLVPLVERVVLGSHYAWTFMVYRLQGIWDILANHGDLNFIAGQAADNSHFNLPPIDALLGELNFRAAFLAPDLWLGLLAAAAMLYAATRIRRYRDDT
ncbi:MAG: ABC transporter permease [Steroidobacteraceae bacterium]